MHKFSSLQGARKGLENEPRVLDEYVRQTGVSLDREQKPVGGVTPDAVQLGPHGQKIPVEVKTMVPQNQAEERMSTEELIAHRQAEKKNTPVKNAGSGYAPTYETKKQMDKQMEALGSKEAVLLTAKPADKDGKVDMVQTTHRC